MTWKTEVEAASLHLQAHTYRGAGRRVSHTWLMSASYTLAEHYHSAYRIAAAPDRDSGRPVDGVDQTQHQVRSTRVQGPQAISRSSHDTMNVIRRLLLVVMYTLSHFFATKYFMTRIFPLCQAPHTSSYVTLAQVGEFSLDAVDPDDSVVLQKVPHIEPCRRVLLFPC